MTLSTAWTKHLPDPKAQENFEIVLRNNTQLFTRLEGILQERINELNKASFSESDFEDPNWSHKQAHRLGKLSVLKWLQDLIPIKG